MVVRGLRKPMNAAKAFMGDLTHFVDAAYSPKADFQICFDLDKSEIFHLATKPC